MSIEEITDILDIIDAEADEELEILADEGF